MKALRVIAKAWRIWFGSARAVREVRELDAYVLRDLGVSHRAALEATDRPMSGRAR